MYFKNIFLYIGYLLGNQQQYIKNLKAIICDKESTTNTASTLNA